MKELPGGGAGRSARAACGTNACFAQRGSSALAVIIRTFLSITLLLTLTTHSRAADSLRYLFMVEISPEMATRKVASANILHDIVATSFDSEIKPGELFAVWFYGSRLQTNPPIVWRPGNEAAIARYSANLFGGRVFGKVPPRDTLAAAAPFIAAAPKLTIFLFTDGSIPIVGTPFDAEINRIMEQRYSLFSRAERPFVVTFIASKGKLIHGSVHAAVDQRFKIPELDRQDETLANALQSLRNAPQPKPADAADLDKALAAVRNATPVAPQNDAEKARAALREALEGKTNSAPAEKIAMQVAPTLREPPKEQPPVEQPKPQPPPEKPKEIPSLLARPPETYVVPPSGGPAVEPNPPAQNKIAAEQTPATKPIEVATQPRPAEKPPETKPSSTPPVETPNPATIQSPKPVTVTSSPKPPVTETIALTAQKPIITESKATPEPKKIAMAPPPATVERKSESNTPVAAKPSSPAPPPIQTAAVTPSSHFPWPALIGGLAVIFVGGAIAVIRAKRRAKAPGSIITQALPRNGPRFK